MPIDLSRRIRMPHPRVILYGRVSRDQRSGRSCEQQLTIGRTRVREIDGEIVAEYSDNDRSASRYARKAREDWPKVEEDIRAGAAQILWLWEFSRGTRERLVWATLAEACQEHGLFIMLDDRLYDTTDPDDMRYLDGLMADSVAESGRTRKRVLRDVAAQAEIGAPHGRAAYGYKREYDPDSGALLRQVVDPAESAVIRRAAEYVLKGKHLSSLAAQLNREGVPIPAPERVKEGNQGYWRQGTLRKILLTPTIMGKRAHKGRIKEAGGWEHILTPEQYWEVRKKLRPIEGPGSRNSVRHLLSGIAVCDVCESPLYTRKAAKTHKVYRCTPPPGMGATHVSRTKHRLEEHVETLLVTRFVLPDVLDAFSADPESLEQAAADELQLAELKKELEEAREAAQVIGPGRLSARGLIAVESALLPQIEELEMRVQAQHQEAEPLAVELADEDPAAVLKTWRSWDLAQKRTALRLFTVPKGIRVLRTGRTGRRQLLPSESVGITWVGEGEPRSGRG